MEVEVALRSLGVLYLGSFQDMGPKEGRLLERFPGQGQDYAWHPHRWAEAENATRNLQSILCLLHRGQAQLQSLRSPEHRDCSCQYPWGTRQPKRGRKEMDHGPIPLLCTSQLQGWAIASSSKRDIAASAVPPLAMWACVMMVQSDFNFADSRGTEKIRENIWIFGSHLNQTIKLPLLCIVSWCDGSRSAS